MHRLRWVLVALLVVSGTAGCAGRSSASEAAGKARSVCHSLRDPHVADGLTTTETKTRLAELTQEAQSAAQDDTKWEPLATALVDAREAVARASEPGADLTKLVSQVQRSQQIFERVCARADPEDGWGTTVYVPSGSMEPTVKVGDWIGYEPVHSPSDIHRGTIVLFDGPRAWRDTDGPQRFFKRVIGLGGEHIVCCDSTGRITVDGTPLDEPYLYDGDKPSEQRFDVRVPDGYLWIMGDHRSASADSRAHIVGGHNGCIPVKAVVGIVDRISDPPSRAAPIPTPAYR